MKLGPALASVTRKISGRSQSRGNNYRNDRRGGRGIGRGLAPGAIGVAGLLSSPGLHPVRMWIDGRTNVGASEAPSRNVTALPHRQTFSLAFVYPLLCAATSAGAIRQGFLSRATYLDLRPYREDKDVLKTGRRKWPQRVQK